jgi:DNA-binding transcriptional ArsR family regulator
VAGATLDESALTGEALPASSEAADVVLTVDRIYALGDAILIARRARSIAVQAVGVAMGLSAVAMLAAAAGLLPLALGAVLQEVIDLLAILIALRAVLPGPRHTLAMPAIDIAAAGQLRAEHDAVGSRACPRSARVPQRQRLAAALLLLRGRAALDAGTAVERAPPPLTMHRRTSMMNHPCIDICQCLWDARAMAQTDSMLLPLADDGVCCAPLAEPPLDVVAAMALARQLKALADPARLQLLSIVVATGSACICDLTEPVGLSQPTVSHHMKVLVDAGLLHREKRGKWVHFSVNTPALRDLGQQLADPRRTLAPA